MLLTRQYFRSKNIGDVGCISGGWYKTYFNVYVLNKPDYNIMIMSNFLGLIVPEDQKEEIRMVNGEVVKFKYPEVVADNFRHTGGGVKPQCLEALWWD